MNTPETGEKPTIDDRLRRDRKYKAFWGVFLMATFLGVVDKLSTEYVTLITAVYGLYMAGNVGEHWTKRGQ